MPLTFGNTPEASGRRSAPSRERMLVVALEPTVVTVLDATRSGESLVIHASGRWNWPEGVSPSAHPEPAGAWLRSQLEAHAISPRPVLLVLPRQAVMLKLLEIPEVPAEELAAVVMLQAESRLSRPLNEQCVDFVTTPDRRHALLVGVPNETLQLANRFFEAAGLTCLSATVGEFNLVERDSLHVKNGTQLAIYAEGERAELTLSSSGTAIASLTVRFHSSVDVERRQLIASTIARLIASLPSGLSQPGIIETVSLFGAGVESLVPDAESIACPHAVIMRHAGDREAHANEFQYPLLSQSLKSRAFESKSIDLLHPRRPPDASARLRRRRWRIAAVVAALLAGAAYFLFDYSRSLDREIAQLKQREAELAALIKRGQPLLGAAEFAGEWRQGQIDWPEELTRFAECLPPTDRAYLTQLSLDVTPDMNSPVIRVNGRAKEVLDVLQFHQRLLSEESGYELRPHGIEPSSRDSLFRSTFDVEAAIKFRNGT